MPTRESERIGFLSLILAPIVIYGGIQMLKGKKIKFAKASAILAMLPYTACCFVLGIPFGIWALIVLSKPDVKDFFKGTTNLAMTNPPQPPEF